MELNKDQNDIYEVEFEELEQEKLEPIDSKKAILDAQLNITVSVGSSNEKLGKIAKLKVGDLIVLDKLSDQYLDININGKKIASGESIVLGDTLAIKISKVNVEDE